MFQHHTSPHSSSRSSTCRPALASPCIRAQLHTGPLSYWRSECCDDSGTQAALLYPVSLRPCSSDFPTSQNITWFSTGHFLFEHRPLVDTRSATDHRANVHLFVCRDVSRSFYDKHRDGVVSSNVNAPTADIPADHGTIGRQFRMQVTTAEDTPTYAHEAGKHQLDVAKRKALSVSIEMRWNI
jgi:hypothetical protein